MNLTLFLFALQRAGQLSWAAFVGCLRQRALTRAFLLVLFLPLLFAVQLIHWLGFLLDELLFPDYHQVRVNRPLFIIGVPRSGTTFLQRVMAADPQLTTLSTWECLLAPSISQRRCWLALAWLDRKLKGPLACLLRNLQRHLNRRFDAVHVLRLEMPEEDYLTLLPLFSCFLLILAVPEDRFLWRLGWFDQDLQPRHQKRLLSFYHAMQQKHLYVHGPDRTLLVKNPAFCSWIPALRELYPDCRIICPFRDPLKTYRSQLSSISAGLALLQLRRQAPQIAEQFLDLYQHAYQVLFAQIPETADKQLIGVSMTALKNNLSNSLSDLYRQLKLPLDDAFRASLESEAEAAAGYHSQHHYSLQIFQLDDGRAEQVLAKAQQEFRRRWPTDPTAPVRPHQQPVDAVETAAAERLSPC